ncbi:DUF6531 domain-containing protein [Sanguibacter sp. 25GB23B1]|uniref:DUF6531 domain-containing protein n=1 Tax=unclassified Sanguibacter TaxID=2645534 RepID=UPI0032AED16D
MPAAPSAAYVAVTADPAPVGTVADSSGVVPVTPTSAPVEEARVESWTPSSHSVTENGETTLDLFPQPAFKRTSDGWSAVDPTITAGAGAYPFEALGLVNPVHFGSDAAALVTIDTTSGPIAFGLEGATVTAPTLDSGVVTYAEVFPGVDLEFRTEGGRVGKHLVIHDGSSPQSFRFVIADPGHTLGDPVEGNAESWDFPSAVAFGTGISLPAPAAWSAADQSATGLPGSSHQEVSVVPDGYAVDLSLDPLWAAGAEFPVVLDPAIEWTDEYWTQDDGLSLAFAPTGATTCDGGPCQLADPVEGRMWVGDPDSDDPDLGSYLAYAGVDLSALSDRQVTSAVLSGYDYWVIPELYALCSPILADSTGRDLSDARCDATTPLNTDRPSSTSWFVDTTETVRSAISGTGPTGLQVGFAIDGELRDSWAPEDGRRMYAPYFQISYSGYPAPRPLTQEQTFGCDCWAGRSTANQALAADPVNTATGALIERFEDLSIAGVGQQIDLARTYNSLDTAPGPFGPGWAYSYGATLTENASGELVFRDGSGTQSRFGALIDGGYAPLDPAVSADLTAGPDGTHVMRNLTGSTMTFDSAGLLVAAADERGQGLTFAYSAGTLTTITDALGQSLELAWDSGVGTDARITSATASDGRTVSYTYTTTAGDKRLTAVTGVDGTTTTIAYASTGGISKITDPLGNVSARNTYDSAGRIVKQLDQMGFQTTFAWDASTQTATITDPTGKTRQDVYNGLNLVKQIDGSGASTQTLYDGDNNPAGTVNDSNQLFRQEFDDRDRLVRRVASAPLHYSESWTYDDGDRVTSYTDAEGHVTSYAYDTSGLLLSETDANGGVTTYAYTTGSDDAPAHLLASVTDPLGRTTTMDYDAAGDLVSTTSPGGRVTTSTYDAQHRVTSTTSPSGAVTSFTYDAAGRLLTSTDPLGAITKNAYDLDGRLTSTTNPLGRVVRYTYDKADRLLKVRHSSGRTTSTSYDKAGRVATTTDALGAVTSYAYDDTGRPISVTDALGQVATTTYDDLGQVIATTDPSGAITTYTYDVIGRQTSVTDPDGVTVSTSYNRRGDVTSVHDAFGYSETNYDPVGRVRGTYDSDGVYAERSYDAAGQLTEIVTERSTSNYIPNYWSDRTTFGYDLDGFTTTTVDPRGNVPGADPAAFTTTRTYDADGRLAATTDPLGRTVSTSYDLAARPLSVTDPAGFTTSTAYNALGLPVTITEPNGARTQFAYDGYGQVTKRVDQLGRSTLYAYDAAGSLISQTDPLGRVTSTAYDAVGNVSTITKPSGTATSTVSTDGQITYDYDEVGRVTSSTFSDGTPSFQYTYTPAGRPQAASRVQDTTTLATATFAYDAAGRKTSTERTGPGGGTSNYAYTSTGRLAGASWPTGQSEAYSYNSLGQLTTITPSGVGAVGPVSYQHDPAGLLTSVTRNGAVINTSTSTYDAAGQLESLTHSAAGTPLSSYGIVRDVRGNPSTVTASRAAVDTTPASTKTTLYSYDKINRITSECQVLRGATCTSTSAKTAFYYDKVGNRTSQNVRPAGGGASVVTDYAYDTADQLLTQQVAGTVTATDTWDLNGNLLTSQTSAGTRTFDVNLAGETDSVVLEDGNTVGYTHDAQGNRTSRTYNDATEATWAWDDITGITTRLAEYDQNGAMTSTWLPDPTSSTGTPLAWTNTTETSWLLSDPFKNVSDSVPAGSATVAGSQTLGAFGTPIAPASGSMIDQSLGFHGQYLDARTGLYNVRARDYSAQTGRFTASDPITIPHGSPYANGYTYGFGNPMIATDPSGLWPDWSEIGSAIGDSFATAGRRFVGFSTGIALGVGDTATGLWGVVRHTEETAEALSAQWNADMDEGGLYQAAMFYNPGYHILVNGAATIDAIKAGCATEAGRSFAHTTLSVAGAATLAGGTVRAGAGLARKPGASVPTGIAANQAAGNAGRDAIAARFPGSQIEQTFTTSAGVRRLDVLTVTRMGIETKVGRTSLTTMTTSQIAKDSLLLQSGQVRSIEWMFMRSGVTGQIGPTAPLAAALNKAGINWSLVP